MGGILSQEKFMEGDSTTFSLVLDADGVEIDNDFFNSLEGNVILMLLKTGETWEPQDNKFNRHERVTLKSEEEKMIAMIDKLREKVKKRKLEPARLDREVNSTSSTQSSNLKFHCGWKHYSFASNVYKQVKSNSKKLKLTDCGSQIIFVKYNATYEEVIEKLTDKYYPCGRSKKGSLHKMTLSLRSFTETINRENFSALQFYNERKTSEARIYLLSKEKIHDMLAITDSDSDELESLGFPGNMSPPEPEIILGVGKPMTSPAMNVPFRSSTLGTPNIATPQAIVSSRTPTLGTPTLGTSIGAFGGTPIGATDTNKPIVFHADTPTVTFSYDRRCQICVDRERDAYLSPCGHTFCLVCALQVENMGQNCPSCRGEIDKVCSMFL
ncbi:uncharacterized protein LOC127733444 [Mytilus californianus]|uniref:uncharacterized protein LOC127733444 n=1 Tax=Mytilus californianus TaxID=6549 RepID=UPI00224559E4|nr:uncharacterized protein LOC127733444 [Mytilus californianus]